MATSADVEPQAVFTLWRARVERDVRKGRLRADRPERGDVDDPCPRFRRFWGTETQVAQRRRGVAYAPPNLDLTVIRAAVRAIGRFDHSIATPYALHSIPLPTQINHIGTAQDTQSSAHH
jgi:hypothetical protein